MTNSWLRNTAFTISFDTYSGCRAFSSHGNLHHGNTNQKTFSRIPLHVSNIFSSHDSLRRSVMWFQCQCRPRIKSVMWFQCQCRPRIKSVMWFQCQCRPRIKSVMWFQCQCRPRIKSVMWFQCQCRPRIKSVMWFQCQCRPRIKSVMWFQCRPRIKRTKGCNSGGVYVRCIYTHGR